MRNRARTRTLFTVTAALASAFAVPKAARASNVSEIPDNGTEQMQRGGAWVARASEPLAAFYNPAGLAGQDTRLALDVNVFFQNTCFSRIKAANDASADPVARADGTFPRVCNDVAPTPNPNLAFTYRLTDRLGLGLAVLAPSSTGQQTWPDFVNTADGKQAAPQRYILLKQSGIILTPTLGAGYEIVDGLRIGASFNWGIARVRLSNASVALNADGLSPSSNDIKADVLVKDYFFPGFTAGVLWSASDWLDLAAWYKWSAPIDATGNLVTSGGYFGKANASGDASHIQYGDTRQADCNTGDPSYATTCGSGNNAHVKFNVPMEAKLGVRFHKTRNPLTDADRRRRDPLGQDIFDVEVDLTYANDSAIDAYHISFPADANGNGLIPVPGTPGFIPPNADVPRNYRDVFGVRVGGDYAVIPDALALRAGAYFENAAQPAQYQSLDFVGGARIGLAGGGTYRIHLGDGASKSALELSLGFAHVFVTDLSNTSPTAPGVDALTGTPCNPTTNNSNGATCADGKTKYRTNWPVNLGTVTNSINVVSVGGAYRF